MPLESVDAEAFFSAWEKVLRMLFTSWFSLEIRPYNDRLNLRFADDVDLVIAVEAAEAANISKSICAWSNPRSQSRSLADCALMLTVPQRCCDVVLVYFALHVLWIKQRLHLFDPANAREIEAQLRILERMFPEPEEDRAEG
jgi:hypothetical protein